MPKILLVEDEVAIAEGLTASLEAEGFRPVWVSSGDRTVSAWERERPDLVLLDLMLPGTSGTEVCRRLRARSNVPIIMVTARGGEVDRVVGLELGADDYVTKPFSTRELIARIRAVLRRDVRIGAPASDEVVEAGGVRVDPARREVTVSERVLQLPPKEFDLLEVLVRNAGLVRTRAQLIAEVWGDDYVGDTRTLDVHIARLRRRIEQDPHHPTRIRTVRGVGYRFADRSP
ncbi:MAG: response regulator transcription factor [Actinomycetota bacterium]|nr:response regulator transcription factor [Actinomycetota bacterium]